MIMIMIMIMKMIMKIIMIIIISTFKYFIRTSNFVCDNWCYYQ